VVVDGRSPEHDLVTVGVLSWKPEYGCSSYDEAAAVLEMA
jgi:hypothetical protein